MQGEDDKTKMYNIQSGNHAANRRNNNEETKKMKSVKGKKVKNKKVCLAAVGAFAAIFFGDTWEITEADLVIKMQNSSTYDNEGKLLHKLNGEENRQIISLSEMGEYIPKAFVAIEDERFYEHSGIELQVQ